MLEHQKEPNKVRYHLKIIDGYIDKFPFFCCFLFCFVFFGEGLIREKRLFLNFEIILFTIIFTCPAKSQHKKLISPITNSPVIVVGGGGGGGVFWVKGEN